MSVESQDAAAVVEIFFACARERAKTEDSEQLADEGGDLLSYEAYWEDRELVLALRRQFALLEDGEDEEYLDRLLPELRTRSAPAETPESSVIQGVGGSDATVCEWARRLRSEPAFAAMMAAPVDVVLFDHGPICDRPDQARQRDDRADARGTQGASRGDTLRLRRRAPLRREPTMADCSASRAAVADGSLAGRAVAGRAVGTCGGDELDALGDAVG